MLNKILEKFNIVIIKKISVIISILVLIPNIFHSRLIISKMSIQKDNLNISLFSDSTNFIDMGKIIDDGMNIKVIYHFTLKKKGEKINPDQIITNLNLLFQNKKDVINDGYESQAYFNKESWKRWFPNINELLTYLLVINNFKIISMKTLDMNSSYFLEIQQEIISLELYPPLNLIYNMMGNWNYSSRKIRSKYFNMNGILNE